MGPTIYMRQDLDYKKKKVEFYCFFASSTTS